MQEVLEPAVGRQSNGAVGLVRPQTVRQGIVLYARVPSTQESDKRYWVKKRRTGHRRFAYSCTCEGSFLGGHLCRHIAAFKLAEAA